MFTNNYVALRHNTFFGVFYNSPITTPSGSISAKTFRDAGGSTVNQYKASEWDIGAVMGLPRCASIPTSNITNATTLRQQNMGVYFGAGSSPATLADYTLESTITTGLAFSGGLEKVSAYENGKAEVIARYIVTNTSDAEINIWEIGCFMPIQSSSSSQYKLVMVERTVLTEPITIPAGESKMVTYKVVFNQTLSVD